MFRIRLASGEEAVYRSVEELAKAAASGLVSAQAEVFHNAAGRWLPIETHPGYRAAVSGKSVAEPAPAPRPPLRRPRWSPRDPARQSTVEPSENRSAAVESVGQPDTPPAPSPAPHEPASPAPDESMPSPVRWRSQSRTSRPRVVPALAAGLLAVSLLGAGYALRRDLPALGLSWRHEPSEGMAPLPPRLKVAAAPSTPPVSFRPRPPEVEPPTYPAPSRPLPVPATARTAPGLEAATTPQVEGAGSSLTPRSGKQSYVEAYAQARAEMEESLEDINFRRIFDHSRFGGPDSLRAARRLVATAGNIFRVYRSREVQLEEAYHAGDPDRAGSLRETFATAEGTRALLSDADSLYGLLLAQQGKFTLGRDGVRFQSPQATQAYAELRSGIISAIARWGDSAGEVNRVTTPRVLRAIGPDLPPPLR